MKPLTEWPANRIAHHLNQDPKTLLWHVWLRPTTGPCEDCGAASSTAEAYTLADAYVAKNHKGKTL